MKKESTKSIAGNVFHLMMEDTAFDERSKELMVRALLDGVIPKTFPSCKTMIRELMKLKECISTVTSCVSYLDNEDSSMLIQLFYLRFILAKKALSNGK
jgi:hypothetical protein